MRRSCLSFVDHCSSHSASPSPSPSLSANRNRIMSSSPVQVWGMNGSTCCQRILATAFENGAEVNMHLVDLFKGQQKTADFLKKQPFGKVPYLEEDGFVVYESHAISRYVNDTRGNKLVPIDAKKRALMEQWISLEATTITVDLAPIAYQRVILLMFGKICDDAVVAAHAAKLQHPYDVMDAHLANNRYLAGDQFTLADVFQMPYTSLVMRTPEKSLIESRPNVLRWWKEISARESWVKTLDLSEFKPKA